MTRLAGLRPALLTVGLLGLVLAGLMGLAQTNWRSLVIPSPEQEAEAFYRSLMAHNFDAARDRLSQELADTVSVEQLLAAVRRLEHAPARGIDDVAGYGSRLDGDSAQATVRVALKNLDHEEVTVALTREHAGWRIASLPPIETLGP